MLDHRQGYTQEETPIHLKHTFTLRVLQFAVASSLTCVYFVQWKKPENPEETQTDIMRMHETQYWH